MPLGRQDISIDGVRQCQAKQDMCGQELSLGGRLVQPRAPLPVIAVQEFNSMQRLSTLVHECGPDIYTTKFFRR
jgi:hypothetical protein